LTKGRGVSRNIPTCAYALRQAGRRALDPPGIPPIRSLAPLPATLKISKPLDKPWALLGAFLISSSGFDCDLPSRSLLPRRIGIPTLPSAKPVAIRALKLSPLTVILLAKIGDPHCAVRICSFCHSPAQEQFQAPTLIAQGRTSNHAAFH
jgi:hypothetical protein